MDICGFLDNDKSSDINWALVRQEVDKGDSVYLGVKIGTLLMGV